MKLMLNLTRPRPHRLHQGVLILIVALAIAVGLNASVHGGEPADFESHTVTVDSLNIHYRTGGSGPVLLMMHGFTLTGDQWLSLADDFLDEYTVVIPDLPGHGGSSFFDGPFSFEATANIMFGLLDSLGVEQGYAMGHSAGAITLLHMAAAQSERIEAMALVGGALALGPEADAVFEVDTWESQDQAVKDFYRSLHPGGDEQAQRIFDMYNGLGENDEHVSLDALKNIKSKCLLIWGDDDRYFPLETVLPIYRTIPNAALWVLPELGHTPFWPEFGGSETAARFYPQVVKGYFSDTRN